MSKSAFIIGVAGGASSGKTTVCNLISESFRETGEGGVSIICIDNFLKEPTKEQREKGTYNIDDTESIDLDLLIAAIKKITERKAVTIPKWDVQTLSRVGTTTVEPSDVVIVTGRVVLAIESVRSLFHMKIFVDTDDDVRLARFIVADTKINDVATSLARYANHLKPTFDQIISPSKKEADVIIPWTFTNTVALDLICQHIRSKTSVGDLRAIFHNFHMMPGNSQVRAMQTIIRDKTVQGHTFQFYADRLARLVVEFGLGFLRYRDVDVITPATNVYRGKASNFQSICGVSLIRGGEAMEGALRACCMGVKMGKILVTKPKAGENPEVRWYNLPKDIQDRHVFLLTPVLMQGGRLGMAIKLLMDMGVKESKIVILTISAGDKGIQSICSKYPQVQLITTEVEAATSADSSSLGSFGNRYFGTTCTAEMTGEELVELKQHLCNLSFDSA